MSAHGSIHIPRYRVVAVRRRIGRERLRRPVDQHGVAADRIDAAAGRLKARDVARARGRDRRLRPVNASAREDGPRHRPTLVDRAVRAAEALLDADGGDLRMAIQSRAHDLIMMELSDARVLPALLSHELEDLREGHVGEGGDLELDLDRLHPPRKDDGRKVHVVGIDEDLGVRWS